MQARERVVSKPVGTERVAELLRQAEGLAVKRASVEAAGQRKNSISRVRANGGVLELLCPEGVPFCRRTVGGDPRRR